MQTYIESVSLVLMIYFLMLSTTYYMSAYAAGDTNGNIIDSTSTSTVPTLPSTTPANNDDQGNVGPPTTGSTGSAEGPGWDYSWGWGAGPRTGWGYGFGSSHSSTGSARGFGFGSGTGSGSGSGSGYGYESGGAAHGAGGGGGSGTPSN